MVWHLGPQPLRNRRGECRLREAQGKDVPTPCFPAAAGED